MITLAKASYGRASYIGISGGGSGGGALRINKTIGFANARYGRASAGSWKGHLVTMAKPTLLSRKLPLRGASFSTVTIEQQTSQITAKSLHPLRWFDSTNIRQGLDSLREAMIRERRPLEFLGLRLKTNISNLCGHASFVVLALAYLETDVLALRGYAASGIGLSILFQFYRVQPLWIPIGWNGLFLGINLTMIGLLLKERNDAVKLEEDPEQARTFREVFEPVELTPVDFVRLMDLAERREMPKGKLLSEENKVQEEVFLIMEGTAEVESEGVVVCHLETKQFVGSMCFNRFIHAFPGNSSTTSSTNTSMHAPSAPLSQSPPSYHSDELHPGQPTTNGCDSKDSQLPSVDGDGVDTSGNENTEDVSEDDELDVLNYIDDSYVPGGKRGGVLEGGGEGTLYHSPREWFVGEVIKSLGAGSSQGAVGGGSERARADHVSLERSLTTVTTTSDVVVYAWDMHLLRAFIKRRPLAGASLHKAISADLNRKVEQSRGHEERYRLLLVETLDGGVITPIEKKKLHRYRDLHSISYKEHEDLLSEHGWTEEEFEAGFQKSVPPRDGSKDFLKYEALVRRELANGEVKEKERQQLREFRAHAGIDAQEHLLVLEKQGWTADDYEIGGKGKAAELEKLTLKVDIGGKPLDAKDTDVSYKLSKGHKGSEHREHSETVLSSKANISIKHDNDSRKATGGSNTLSPQPRTSGLAKAATVVTVPTVS